MSIRSDLESLSPAQLIEGLSSYIYEPPFCTARQRYHEIADALKIPMLVLDFDIAVHMEGMLGFLENSTGLFFAETIEAFDEIGACETVPLLRAQSVLDKHGVTPRALRADFTGTQAWEITTFQKLHGDLGTMPNEVEQVAKRLYLYAKPGAREPIWSLLETFVEKNRAELIAEIARIAGE